MRPRRVSRPSRACAPERRSCVRIRAPAPRSCASRSAPMRRRARGVRHDARERPAADRAARERHHARAGRARVALVVRRARSGAERGTPARQRARAAQGREAGAGDAAARREGGTRQACDAHGHARRDAVRRVATRCVGGGRARAVKAVEALQRARQPAKAPKPSANVRSVRYSTSPLLASKTPPWRSKFLVALVGLSFCVLLGRAAYIQIVGSAFFLKQGEIRYARTLELPASRGRIVDRNGLILASSVPAPSLWAIPKDFEADKAQQVQLARLLEMTPSELAARLDDNTNFVWLRRQVDDAVAQQVLALGVKGVHQVRE